MSDEMIHIKSVHVEGYKSILDAEVEFLPGLNVIIGKNGAGKSNLLRVMDAVMNPDSDLFYLDEVFIDVALGKDQEEWFSLRFDRAKPMHETPERFSFFSSRDEVASPLEDKKLHAELIVIGHATPNGLPFLDVPFTVAEPAKLPDLGWAIERTNDRNYPGYCKCSFSSLFDLLADEINEEDAPVSNASEEDAVRKLISIIETSLGIGSRMIDDIISFSPVEEVRLSYSLQKNGVLKAINIAYEFYIGGKWHSFSDLSDGTRRLIHILFSIEMPRRTSKSQNGARAVVSDYSAKVILLEEPELGIHPHQLNQLLQFLKAQSRKHQIIITTHSPTVLDVIGREELDRIIIASYDDKLGSTFKHLDEDQKSKALAYMKEDFLSDYWRYSDLEPRAKLW